MYYVHRLFNSIVIIKSLQVNVLKPFGGNGYISTVREMLGHIGSKRMWAAFMQPEGEERKRGLSGLQLYEIIIGKFANSDIFSTC